MSILAEVSQHANEVQIVLTGDFDLSESHQRDMGKSSCYATSFLVVFMEHILSQMVRDPSKISKLLAIVSLSHPEQAVSVDVLEDIPKFQNTSEYKLMSVETLVRRHEALQKNLELFIVSSWINLDFMQRLPILQFPRSAGPTHHFWFLCSTNSCLGSGINFCPTKLTVGQNCRHRYLPFPLRKWRNTKH